MFYVNLHIQSRDETEAKSFSGPVVLVLEASHHSLPHVLKETHTLGLKYMKFCPSTRILCNKYIIKMIYLYIHI